MLHRGGNISCGNSSASSVGENNSPEPSPGVFPALPGCSQAALLWWDARGSGAHVAGTCMGGGRETPRAGHSWVQLALKRV